ncbi:MAG: LamG domain-containing protein [Planctomycetota bacterium]|nr:MAG: LamG domain-containing protein [Planctomycetota bacterium]
MSSWWGYGGDVVVVGSGQTSLGLFNQPDRARQDGRAARSSDGHESFGPAEAPQALSIGTPPGHSKLPLISAHPRARRPTRSLYSGRRVVENMARLSDHSGGGAKNVAPHRVRPRDSPWRDTMSRVDRREFLRTSTAAGAAAATLTTWPWSARAEAAARVAPCNASAIPPHRVQILYGMHAYADKLSVEPGEEIQFHSSSSVPYKFSVARLGSGIDDPATDQVFETVADNPARLQPIHPGSYVHVEKGLAADAELGAFTVECWVRPHLADEPGGLITQFDMPHQCGFALFLNPGYVVSFYLGDGSTFEQQQLHHTPSGTLKKSMWHHVVGRWDGREKSIWVDGRQVAAWPFAGPLRPGKSALRLGARGDYGEAFRFLDGDLAMPAIYGRALSEEEIKRRRAEQGFKPASGEEVLACWPLDEERGCLVADASGNDHAGRIVNNATWMIGGPAFDPASVPRWADYDPQQDKTRGHGLRLASDDLYDCRWEPSHKVRIPDDARSGFYVGRYEYTLNGSERMYHTLFFVRPKRGAKKPPVCLLAATNTYRAYTYRPFAEVPPTLTWNDYSTSNAPGNPPHYSFYNGHKAGHVCYRLGLRMPSPNSSPYSTSMSHGTEHNYSHLTKADRFTELWLAESGYDYDVITDLDLHQNPDILDGYQVFIVNGHSEYWSVEMRDHVDKYLEQGGNAIVMSGNTMFWRVTYDPNYETIECRKIDAPGNPIAPSKRGESYHSDDWQQGGLMRDCGYPAWPVLGLECLGWDGEVEAMGPFVAENVDHFLYNEPEATGLKEGERFGQNPAGGYPMAGGHEFDVRPSVIMRLQQGPKPEHAPDIEQPEGMDYLGYSIHDWGTAYIIDYYARQIQDKGTLGGEMVLWNRPQGGKVFHAGVIAGGWVLSVDPKFQTMMRNVMHHFGVERNA